ncbi:Ap4A hydrolase [Saitozyma sp. JCM 24511]|nr:Ap4A hydrolase [Saitozyma sp. JCM 24511]
MTSSKFLFSVFDVTRQVFYKTAFSLGIVNLKPLLPGHVLIIPQRVVPRLSDLRPEEVSDLFLTVQHVGRVLEQTFGSQALTISLQDGAAAGQSVPHVHVHILPRKYTDFDGNNDEIYPALEKNGHHMSGAFHRHANGNGIGSGGPQPRPQSSEPIGLAEFRVVSDEDRKPRSMEEMEKEATWLAGMFQNVE